jgi:hypothetical protein
VIAAAAIKLGDLADGVGPESVVVEGHGHAGVTVSCLADQA